MINLVKAIQLYNGKVYTSGNRIEIYKYQAYQVIGKEGNQNGRKGNSGKGAAKEGKKINRKVTLNRARNNIIRLVSCNPDLTTFITLTYKENMQDLSKSKKHLNYFFKKIQKDYKNFKYLYVLEYQGRGAIHYHMLCNLPIDFKTAKKGRKSKVQKEYEQWFSSYYWSNRGFCDVRSLVSEGNTNAGKYIAAYLIEDLMDLDLGGNKCYGFSRNLDKPVIELVDSNEDIEEILSNYKDYKITYTSNYEIHYVDKFGNNRDSNVTYIDMYKKEP